MSLFTIIKLSSYIYLLTSILLPIQIIDLTSQFLSLVFVQNLNSSTIVPHVAKSIVLLVRFVVLYTILGGNAIYSLFQKEQKRENKPTKPQTINKPKKTVVVNQKPADNVTPLDSAADSKLKLTNNEEITEPTTVNPIIKSDANRDTLIESALADNTPSSAALIDEPVSESRISENLGTHVAATNDTEQLIEPLNKVNRDTNQSNLDDEIKSTSPIPIKNNNGDGTTIEKQSVVKNILAQDQLIKDEFIPTSKHVISTSIEKEIQPEKKTEAIVPSTKSHHLEEDEHISTTTTSTTVTPPAEPTTLSVDNKEEFYNNIIKKDSDIKSFSENVKNIFDGPPTTPLPNQKHDSIILPLSLDSNTYHTDNDDIKINNDKQSIPLQSSIEEMMSTATPALTPQAGSTSSRRSSTTSNNTSSPAGKSRLQSALQKLSGPRQSTQQQQTTDPVVMNPSTSNMTISKSKSRFSTIRLTRKKSSGSVMNQSPPEEKKQSPELLDVEVKPSTSSKLNNKLKKTTKRFSKLFAS